MSWFQNIIVMPIVIGYLAQLLIEPDGGLGTFSQLRKKNKNYKMIEIESYSSSFNSKIVDPLQHKVISLPFHL